MKKAFTLLEIIIALGIVSVLSVLLIANLSNSKANENKMKYIKSYDSLREIVSNFVNDTSFYPPIYQFIFGVNTFTYNFDDVPLMNVNRPLVSVYDDELYEGNTKFCNLLREAFDAVEINACDDDLADGLFNFETVNNVRWRVISNLPDHPWNITPNNPDNQNTFLYHITIDVNGDEGPNALNNGNNSDRFEFLVSMDGNVYPRDVVGQEYVNTRSNYKFRPLQDGFVQVGLDDTRFSIRQRYTRTVQ